MRKSSATGTRTRVARVRAEYPNQLDYGGIEEVPEIWLIQRGHLIQEVAPWGSGGD